MDAVLYAERGEEAPPPSGSDLCRALEIVGVTQVLSVFDSLGGALAEVIRGKATKS